MTDNRGDEEPTVRLPRMAVGGAAEPVDEPVADGPSGRPVDEPAAQPSVVEAQPSVVEAEVVEAERAEVEPVDAERIQPEPLDVERAAAEPDGTDSAAADQHLPDEPSGAGGSVRRPRVSAAGAVIGLLLGLLGFALVVQMRSNAADPGLAAARPEDLVRILSDLDARQDRLRQEIASLEESQRQLASGAQGREAALNEARRRADELGILAGTLPTQGPGLEIRFAAGGERIRASTVLDAVEELRGAGAEAMQIAGQGSPAVRIVASTYFTDSGDGLVVDGMHLNGVYRLDVIGDPQTMRTALNIPGGVVDTVRQRGGNVIVQESDAVRVTALHQVGAPRYARPVS